MSMNQPDLPARLSEWIGRWTSAADDRSQASLARAIGISPPAITHWLNGQGRPDPIKTLPALCRVLDLSTEEAREAYRLCGVDLRPTLGVEGAA